MNENQVKKYPNTIFIFIAIATYILTILLLIRPYFLQNPYVVFPRDEVFSNALLRTFLLSGLSFDRMYYVGEFTSPFVISIYKILMFFVSIYSIFVLISKFEFFESNNKLTKAIQYMVLSISILILSIMNYYGGYLEKINYEYYPHAKVEYVIGHTLIPIVIAILLILLDIPHLVVGIKEYKKSKKLNYNIKLNFKDRLKYYIKDTQSFIIIVIFFIAITSYLIAFIAHGGIEYPDPKQVAEYLD